MKKLRKFISIFLTGISSISIFSTGVLTLISKNNEYVIKFKTRPFSYKSIDNKIKGFEHVNLKIFQSLDLIQKKYRYFLSDVGIKYLIDRFIETGLIGPEIAGLRSIIIGDKNSMTDKELGRFIASTNEIYINIEALLKNTNSILKENSFTYNKAKEEEIQKERAELILDTLIHEYGHYLFTYYVNSPTSPKNWQTLTRAKIDDETNFDQLSTIADSYNPPPWNHKFYNEFTEIFYPNSRSRETFFNTKSNPKVTRLIQVLKTNNHKLSLLPFIGGPETYVTPNALFTEANNYNSSKTLKLFDWSQKFIGGAILSIIGKPPETNVHLLTKIIRKYSLSKISYYYSMEELVTRKLLPIIYKRAKYYGTQDIFKRFIMGGILEDAVQSSFLLWNQNQDDPNKPKYQILKFFNDNVYDYAKNSKDESGRTNNNTKPLQYLNLIERVMTGTNDDSSKPEISFISSKSPWKVINAKIKILNNSIQCKHKTLINSWNQIKLGGYLPNDEPGYTDIGYLDKNNQFISIDKIKKHDFKLGYKEYMFDAQWKTVLGNHKYKYWYTKNFVDFQNYANKPLYFGKIVNGTVDNKQIKEIKTFRDSLYGRTSNYNIGMYYSKDNDDEVGDNTYDNCGNTYDILYNSHDSQNYWWIVPQKNNNGVILKKKPWKYETN